MTVYFDEERQRWRYDFYRKKQRYFGYCLNPDQTPVTTRADAEDIEALRRAEAIQKPQEKAVQAKGGAAYSLAMAISARTVIATRLKSWSVTSHYLREILGYFKPETALSAIDKPSIEGYINWGLQQHAKIWLGGPRNREKALKLDNNRVLQKEVVRTRSPKTMNKHLSALNQVLLLAHDTFDPTTINTGNPQRLLAIMPAVPFLKVSKKKPRPIALDHLAKIFADAPDHLQETLTGIQLTQLRISEMLRLPASDIDEDERGIRLDDRNKGGREDFIPLGPKGFAFFVRLKRRAEQVGIDRCILYFDPKIDAYRPIKGVTRSFRTRLKAAGLAGRHRLHQTKSTALTQLRRLGTDQTTLQDMARHADFATTKDHYLGEEVEMRRDAIAKYETRLASVGIMKLRREKRGISTVNTKGTGKTKAAAVPHGSPTRRKAG